MNISKTLSDYATNDEIAQLVTELQALDQQQQTIFDNPNVRMFKREKAYDARAKIRQAIKNIDNNKVVLSRTIETPTLSLIAKRYQEARKGNLSKKQIKLIIRVEIPGIGAMELAPFPSDLAWLEQFFAYLDSEPGISDDLIDVAGIVAAVRELNLKPDEVGSLDSETLAKLIVFRCFNHPGGGKPLREQVLNVVRNNLAKKICVVWYINPQTLGGGCWVGPDFAYAPAAELFMDGAGRA